MTGSGGNVSINFNLCAYTFRTCPDGFVDYANIVNENNTCAHLTDTKISNIGVKLIDEEYPELGLILDLYSGSHLCNATDYFTLQLQLNCDQYSNKPSFTLDTAGSTLPCSPRIIMDTSEACPVLSLGTLWHFFNTYYYIFGVTMILTGLFLMIFGGRLFKVTMFLAGMVSVTAFIMIIMFAMVYPSNSPMWVVWLTLMVGAGMGCGVGYAA